MPIKMQSPTSRGERLFSHSNIATLGKKNERRLRNIFEISEKKPVDGLEFNQSIFDLYSFNQLLEGMGVVGSTNVLPNRIILPLPDSFDNGEIIIKNTEKKGIFEAVLRSSTSTLLPTVIVYRTNEFSPDNIETLVDRMTMLALIPQAILKEMEENGRTIIVIHKKRNENSEDLYQSSSFLRLDYNAFSGAIRASIVYPDEGANMEDLVKERKRVVQKSDKVFFLLEKQSLLDKILQIKINF